MANILEGAVLFAAGALICFALLWWRERNLQKAKSLEIQALLDKARTEAEIIQRDARAAANQEALKLRDQIEQSFTERRVERAESERRLAERETLINSQLQQMMEAEKALKEQKQTLETQVTSVDAEKRQLAELKTQAREQLQKLSGLTELEAREKFLKAVEQEASNDASNLTRRILDDAKSRAEEKARQIISVAIQRYASEHTSESSTSTLALPNDEIKGRIIGR
ncbi:MAG TPA: Rnase Y domain-containing protein, partial [Verrucomicrobiae bacterium]